MSKRLAAIVFIFVCTSIAWVILGATISVRTYAFEPKLRDRVASTWGTPHEQQPPRASYIRVVPTDVEAVKGGKKIVGTIQEGSVTPLPLESTRARVGLALEYRKKGLLWYSTYKVDFAGTYVFRNASEREEWVTFDLKFPAAQAIYDDLLLTLDGAPLSVAYQKSSASATVPVAAGKTAVLTVAYRSQGLDSWRYNFGGEVSQVRDFRLTMTTDFKDVDFPENTLSPSEKRETGDGWELAWSYKNLVSGIQIGMAMPQKLQPGPLSGQISYFAPVSLFFFFFLMFIITTLKGIDLHPMNYFFLAAAFFSFHLLLAL